MQNLDWNDGFSVGIEGIDDDHKKLFSYIAELSAAIENNHTNEVIENIFHELEDYVTIHFSHEEDLMRKCNYPNYKNHVKQHQFFASKIPELKQKLLRAPSTKIAQEVNLFLYDWLMNHIINEDFNYSQQAYEYGLADEKPANNSLLQRIVNWLGQHLVLDYRIAIVAFLPTFALFIISTALLFNASKDLTDIRHLDDYAPLVNSVNTLSHHLQMERGLSIAYSGSKDNPQAHSKLINQRKLTDISINKFKQLINGNEIQLTDKKIKQIFIQNKSYFSRLTEQRRTFDQLADIDTSLAFYGDFIAALLLTPKIIIYDNIESKLTHNFTAFIAIMNLKEAMGKERAVGVLAIDQGFLSNDKRQQFIELIGWQRAFIEAFQYSATSQQKALLDLNCDNEENQIDRQEFYLSIIENDLTEENSQQWFNKLTCKIDKLKILSNTLMTDSNNLINEKVVALEKQSNILAIILLSILALTLILSWLLRRSIIYPIRHLTNALYDLAFGNKKIQLKDKYAKDELGHLLKAYEQCRRHLLIEDISSVINFRRLGEKKAHFEKLSEIDSLTGAFNRRKLINVANQEISRMLRTKMPLSIMILDIDHFKHINDTYGHATGDYILIKLVQTCQQIVRDIDTVARFGGEEFVILMPETNLQQAGILAERIRFVIDEDTIEVNNYKINYSISIGVAEWNYITCNNFDQLIQLADQRLYIAKDSGRNRVIVDG